MNQVSQHCCRSVVHDQPTNPKLADLCSLVKFVARATHGSCSSCHFVRSPIEPEWLEVTNKFANATQSCSRPFLPSFPSPTLWCFIVAFLYYHGAKRMETIVPMIDVNELFETDIRNMNKSNYCIEIRVEPLRAKCRCTMGQNLSLL